MHTSDRTIDRSVDHLLDRADQVAAGLIDRNLPKSAWTHEAHLLACISLVRSHGSVRALAVLRTAIPAYNEATGVANTPTSGYHDTLTVYYVWAIDRLLGEGHATEDILVDPLVGRSAALDCWDRDVLMASAARAAWVPPHRTALDGSLPRLPR